VQGTIVERIEEWRCSTGKWHFISLQFTDGVLTEALLELRTDYIHLELDPTSKLEQELAELINKALDVLEKEASRYWPTCIYVTCHREVDSDIEP